MPMRVSLLFLALVLLFQTQAVFQAQEAMAASDHGRRTARFEVRLRAGKVERITIRVTSTGEFYVIDRFVEGDQAIKDEAEAFSLVERGLYGATACPGKAPCRSACAWAENARPFTRIRYKIPSGRLKLLWPLGKAELEKAKIEQEERLKGIPKEEKVAPKKSLLTAEEEAELAELMDSDDD